METRFIMKLIATLLISIMLAGAVYAYHTQDTAASSASTEGTPYVPGVEPMVRGKVVLEQKEQTSRLNPDRPSRILAYKYGPRQSYRQGVYDYYTRSKIEREDTRPPTTQGSVAIKAEKRASFKKNLPSLFPYTVESGLRQRIQHTKQSPLDKRKATLSTTDQEGGN